MEATAVPVLRQSLSLSALTVVCDRRHFGFKERWGEEGEWIQSNPSDNVPAARRGCPRSPWRSEGAAWSVACPGSAARTTGEGGGRW
jgi:hypothetical protein